MKFGGGCRDVEARIIDTDSGPMIIVHILVDCRDAMGANAVNTMAKLLLKSRKYLWRNCDSSNN